MRLLTVDPASVRFAAPGLLRLLAIPGALLLVWAWQLAVRVRDRKRFARSRLIPVKERFPVFGDLLFWLCVLASSAALIVAQARPFSVSSIVRTAGVDLVVLQDGSASMRVADVEGDRWRRAMRFVRVLGESLSWTNDRLALTVFARIATPQVRLTKDANTFFFFVDHLAEHPPFPLENETTWDTNIESGIRWGLRLIDKDEEFHGRSPNVKGFVLISDGQAWSGEVDRAISLSNARHIPVYVIGVGSMVGGIIPEAPKAAGDTSSEFGPVESVLDRESLQAIAQKSTGEYFELNRDPDRDIAAAVLDVMRRRATPQPVQQQEELYWPLLVAATALVCFGALGLRETAELWLQLAAAVAALLVLNTFHG